MLSSDKSTDDQRSQTSSNKKGGSRKALPRKRSIKTKQSEASITFIAPGMFGGNTFPQSNTTKEQPHQQTATGYPRSTRSTGSSNNKRGWNGGPKQPKSVSTMRSGNSSNSSSFILRGRRSSRSTMRSDNSSTKNETPPPQLQLNISSSNYSVESKPPAVSGIDSQQQRSISSVNEQSILRGFETRVIETHSGKTIVRAPIVDKSAKKRNGYESKDGGPDLPPLTPSELRYNAQRALISTTTVLQSSLSNKSQGSSPRSSPRSPVVGRARGKETAGVVKSKRNSGSVALHSSKMLAEIAAAAPKLTLPQLLDSTEISSNGDVASSRSSRLGQQARSSIRESVLEQWGISANWPPPSPTMDRSQGIDQEGFLERLTANNRQTESESDAEDTVEKTLGALSVGPDPRNSTVGISEESQKLIESIFSGRLSIASNRNSLSPPSKIANLNITPTPLPLPSNTMAPPPPSSSHQMATAAESANRPVEQQQRENTKMRKPSFWSIFRGSSGNQRKDSDEKFAETSSVPTSSSSAATLAGPTSVIANKHPQVLRKQQSSSSGFAETFGLTKLLSKGDHHHRHNHYKNNLLPVGLGSGNSYSNSNNNTKNLPSPPIPPPLPPPPPQAAAAEPTTQSKSATSANIQNNKPPPIMPPSAATSKKENTIDSEPSKPTSSSPVVDAPSAPLDKHDATSGKSGTGEDGAMKSTCSDKYYSPVEEYFVTPTSSSEMAASQKQQMTAATVAADTAALEKTRSEEVVTKSSNIHGTERTQGADTQSAVCSPGDSPFVPQTEEVNVSESDIPLAQALKIKRPTENDNNSSNNNNATVAAATLNPSDETTSNKAQSTKTAVDGEDDQEGLTMATSRIRFSPESPPPKQLPAEQTQTATSTSASQKKEQQDRVKEEEEEEEEDKKATTKPTISPPIPTALNTDVACDTPTLGVMNTPQDNSMHQAQAMGKYLYDIENYHCKTISTASAAVGSEAGGDGSPSVEMPVILQGFEIPPLADHAEWLGKREIFNGLALRHYMSNYDFAGQRIDESLRSLCSHMFLRGESQVIDRVLVALAHRYVDCNPETRLRTADVAHAVTYSTLLLNTDLHIADIRSSDRMSKSRFVRNTLETISQLCHQSQDDSTDKADVANAVAQMVSPPPQLPELDLKQSMESGRENGDHSRKNSVTSGNGLRSLVGSMVSLHTPPPLSTVTSHQPSSNNNGTTISRASRDVARLMGARGKRFSLFESSSSSSPGPSGGANNSSSGIGLNSNNGTTPVVAASPASMRAFDRLRRKVSTNGTHTRSRSGTMSLDESNGGSNSYDLADLGPVLRDVYTGIRNRPLGQPPYARTLGKGATTGNGSVHHSTMAAARNSQDTGGGEGEWFGRASSVRSMPTHVAPRARSIGSLASAAAHHFGGVRASPSMGFTGGGTTGRNSAMSANSLAGNQHMRSGVLVRKHLFERTGRKASHRAWRTCYVSVDRGTVAMYKMDGRHGAHPDGRELTDTSLQLGSVSLRHTMTHMLPPPGYSRARPHVFALQLPSGGVYLFQTASEAELKDWVAACNYWAARESKAPYMIGGVYNMEHGWDNSGDYALRFKEREEMEDRGETLSAAEKAADEQRVLELREMSKSAAITEWAPPTNPMQRTDMDESGQLRALLHHISYLEEELVAHKQIQGSIEERFATKTPQFQKAFSNWERKAQYILQELIKYQSYADVLQSTLPDIREEPTPPPPVPEEPPHTAPIMSPTVSQQEMAPGQQQQQQQQRSAASSPHRNSQISVAAAAKMPIPPNSAATTKTLPIKELLAPDKVKNRNSVIISPNMSATSGGGGGGGGGGGLGNTFS